MPKIAGNLQRIRNGQRRYAITPRIPGGYITPQLMKKIADVAETLHGSLKITAAQRIMITGLKVEDVDKAWEMLGMEPAYSVSNRVRSVSMCPGTAFCKRAKQNSTRLGLQLEKKYISQVMPSKMKIGVSGCPNSCAESGVKDIGVIGQAEGWDIYAGGSAGAHPRLADFICHVQTEAQVLAVVDSMVEYYKANAHIERMGEFIDRIGLYEFKEAVLMNCFDGVELPDDPVDEADTAEAPAEKELPVSLHDGEPITADTIVRDIVNVYPQVVPTLQAMGMGCLGCPSSTGEPLRMAANIHGIDVNELVAALEDVRTGKKGA